MTLLDAVVTASPASCERRRRAAARDELEPELGEPAGEAARARSCRRRRSARAQLSHHLGQQPVLGLVDACAQRLDRVPGEHGNGLARDHRHPCRRPRRRSAPSQRPRERRPRAGPRADARRGSSGSGAGWTLTTRLGKAREERRLGAGACSRRRRRARRRAARASRPSPRRARRGPHSRRGGRPPVATPAACARARALERPAHVRRDRDDRQPRVEQRLQVRPLPAHEHADHAADDASRSRARRPDRGRPRSSRSRG